MAETASRPGRDRRALLGPLWIVWGGILVFAFVLVLLASRLASGDDPALRARQAAVAAPPRRILVRRVEIRRIVHHLPAGAPSRPSQSTSTGGGSAVWGSGVVTRTS